ncbi:MAG TPA: CarD family transcriptional regulator [Kofleriaceae bacterium]|nr:CarD family transcriptional regulator [Kofleriaceae bacterium]
MRGPVTARSSCGNQLQILKDLSPSAGAVSRHFPCLIGGQPTFPPSKVDGQTATGVTHAMSEFKIGDKAVYPAHGVVEVAGVDTKEINGSVCAFYVLKVLENGMQIMVPKQKADQVGLRPVVTSQEANEVFEVLRDQDVHIDKQTWNRRYRGFMEKIKTGSLFDVAEVYRDLFRLKSTKNLSFGERRMLDTARTLMVKELAVARRWTEQKVEQELEKACG